MRGSPFHRVVVVGVGLIGGSIALRARRLPGVRVVGIDRPRVLRRARARGVLDEAHRSLRSGLAGADLIVLALPVEAIARILPRLRRLAPEGAVITDVGSTKEMVVRAARGAGLARRFVGGHPMAGSEHSGVQHADATLLRGASWILCPAEAGAASRVRRFVRLLGARPVSLEARRHDRIVARLSHLPQLLSVALVNAAAAGRDGRTLRLAGPAFRQMSRLAASPPGLWAGILASNRGSLGRALDAFEAEIRTLRRGLGVGCAGRFRRAARLRARFLPPLTTRG
jgi:prephenate dehydrogenase